MPGMLLKNSLLLNLLSCEDQVIRGETCYPGGASHLRKILFIPRLHDPN